MSVARARLPGAETLLPPAPAPARTPNPAPTRAFPGFEPVEAPPWSHRLLPRPLRLTMSGLGMWENPTPQPPSRHLAQVNVVLQRYGWCQTTDVTCTGRLCLRGAQDLLERTGHVTATDRELAVSYMHQALAAVGVRMTFFTWNDLPGQTFDNIQNRLRFAATLAFKKGD